MATFRQILKEKRQSDKGLLSSVGSAALGTTLEKMDPRNYLFKSGSMLNALFPKVKGYQATRERTQKLSTSPSSLLSSTEVSMLSQKLDIIGKNTVAIPTMARDMFLVKENIIKLVKLQGGNPRTKAGDWLSRQFARETAIESKLRKTETSPERVEKKKEEKGFFSSMLGFFTGFLGQGILSMLVKGGLIAGILISIGKYFESPEFRSTVNGMIGGMFSVIDSALKSIFGEDVWSNLTTGVLAAVAAFATYKFAIEGLKTGFLALQLASLKAASGLGVAGLLGAIGPILALGATAYGLYKLIKSDKKDTQSSSEIDSNWTPEMSSVTTADSVTTDEMISGIRPGGLAGLKDDQEKEKKFYQNETKKFLRQQSEAQKNSKSPTPVRNDGIQMLNKIMDQEGITDPNVRNRIMQLAQVESSMNPNAIGPTIQKGMHKGDAARGLLQIMPKTAREMGFSEQDLQDPEKAALSGVRYFMKNYSSLGNLDAATIAHHAGPKRGKQFLETGEVSTKDVATGLSTMDYLAKVTGTPKLQGSTIASESLTLNDAIRLLSSPTVNVSSPTTTNVVQNQQGGAKSSAPAETLDVDLIKLLLSTQS